MSTMIAETRVLPNGEVATMYRPVTLRHHLAMIAQRVRRVSLSAVVAAVVLLALPATYAFGYGTAPTAATLQACPTEDSTDCYWDASRGNGTGRSFVDIGGAVFYAPAGR